MILYKPAVRAIFKRDLRRWFGNPAGYVFITVFVVLATAALFWPDQFFASNLANLDTLNDWFPALLLAFIPAVTMSVWAGERSQGTDELLLTLPASDTQIVLGKFMAGAGIYTIALVFTLPILLFLGWLGNPDWGLLFSNYVGYWLLGLTLVAAGMIGSQMSDNLTVAFIMGLIVCGCILGAERLIGGIAPEFSRTWSVYGPIALFEELGRGVISISSVLLYGGFIASFLYLNLLMLSRRHWRGAEGLHLSIRLGSLVVATIAITVLGYNYGFRVDTTSEQVHSLSDTTRKIVAELPEDRPVYIQAFISPDVPQEYVQTRRTLLDLLREFDASAGNAIQVRIMDTERFSDSARNAETNFQIMPRRTMSEEGGKAREQFIFMGLAFTCGLEEVVIPFLDRGLSVEYEVTRSLRVVASAERIQLGVLDNEVKLFGGLDFQTFQQSPQWQIVRELELQYDVVRVSPDEEYSPDLDALVVAMPSSLTQPQMDRLLAAIQGGVPTLLIDDPLPFAAMSLAASQPRGGQQRNPFGGAPPNQEPKGDIRGMLDQIDILWDPASIAWDRYKPHPQIPLEPELVVIGAASGGSVPFNPDDPVSSGLQEVVAIFGGHLQEGARDDLSFTSLLRTTIDSGTIPYREVLTTNMFGMRQMNPNRRYARTGVSEKVLAGRVKGPAKTEGKNLDVIFVPDLDMISGQFFQIRAQAPEFLRLDNITFVLNCVDSLAGDEEFIALRKRRPLYRTLSTIEEEEKTYMDAFLTQRDEAEQQATVAVGEARKKLNEMVDAIRQRTDLDEQSKQIQIQSAQEAVNRRLDEREAEITRDKERAIDGAKGEQIAAENTIRNFYKFWALALTPIPGILLGFVSLLLRNVREQETTGSRGPVAGRANLKNDTDDEQVNP